MSAVPLRTPIPCKLCGELTARRACYAPTDASGAFVWTPGVVEFALCESCQPQVALQTSAAVALLDELRERARKNLGDIKKLAASISEVGLLQPIVVTPEHELIAGARRIEAVRSLGHKTIHARVVTNLKDAGLLLKAERDENTCRKGLNPIEKRTLCQHLLAIFRPEAKKRQAEHGGTAPGRAKDTSANLAEVSKGETRDSRTTGFRRRFGNESTDLDAIEPNTLRKIVSDAIERHFDPHVLQNLKVVEAAEREQLSDAFSIIGEVTP